jgi:hypothetical protein
MHISMAKLEVDFIAENTFSERPDGWKKTHCILS